MNSDPPAGDPQSEVSPDAPAAPPQPPTAASGPPGLRLADGVALVVLFVGVSMLPTLFSGLLRRTIGYGIGRGWQVVLVELLAGATLIPLGLRWSGQRFR